MSDVTNYRKPNFDISCRIQIFSYNKDPTIDSYLASYLKDKSARKITLPLSESSLTLLSLINPSLICHALCVTLCDALRLLPEYVP